MSILSTIGVGGAKKIYNTISDVFAASNADSSSLTDIASVGVMSPIVVVDQSIVHSEYMHDILQTMQNLYAGYVCLAFSYFGDVGGVRIADTLGRFNPNRTSGSWMKDQLKTGMESLDLTMAQEAYKHRLPTRQNKVAYALEKEDVTMKLGKSDIEFNSSDNMVAGKTYNVSIKQNKECVTVPIMVRLDIQPLSNKPLTFLLSGNGKEVTFSERYHDWRSGAIRFKDMIFLTDLIDDYKKALINDKTGVLSEIQRRANESKKASLVSGKNSLATASNMAIIGPEVQEEVENAISMKISSSRARKMIFDKSYLLSLAVVDPETERVTFYFRDKEMGTDVSFKELKSSNKGAGPDVVSIMKALMGGNGNIAF